MAITNKEVVCLRLKPSTIKKLEEIAEKKDQRKTELMREVLENYIRLH